MLPEDTIIIIASYCSPFEWLICEQVSRHWYQAIQYHYQLYAQLHLKPYSKQSHKEVKKHILHLITKINFPLVDFYQSAILYNPSVPEEQIIELIVCGEHVTGKSSLIHTFVTHIPFEQVLTEYVPNVLEHECLSSLQLSVFEQRVNLKLYDTHGELRNMRKGYWNDEQMYFSQKTFDVYLLMFPVTRRYQSHTITTQFRDAIRKHAPDAPIIAIGAMGDRLSEPNYVEVNNPFVTDDIQQINDPNFHWYMNCDTRNVDQVNQIIAHAILIALKKRGIQIDKWNSPINKNKKKTSTCMIT
jgi:GTPase SAR1 family protein